MHISVVEDNPAILTMVEMALALHGHIVEAYENSPSFISAWQEARRTPPYDLVIVDLFLDQLSGIDIVEAIQLAHPQSVPVILMSAAQESTFVPIREHYPHLPILQKPFTIQALVSLINEATSTEETAWC